ncbi:MAG: type II CRISPR-associated endonuclease Cas1, partial [Muribaculaceae bacterium]
MIKKTLYFGNPTYLSLRDRQLVIKLPEVEKNPDLPPSFKQNSEVTKPIEDIGIIVLDNRQITLTQPLLSALLDVDCALITCDERGLPVGLMLPLYGNTLQSERFRDQIYASTPLKKQLWQQTIVTKIHNQAAVLRTQVGGHQRCMDVWAGEVKSGDADNREARAAEYYWKTLFG